MTLQDKLILIARDILESHASDAGGLRDMMEDTNFEDVDDYSPPNIGIIRANLQSSLDEFIEALQEEIVFILEGGDDDDDDDDWDTDDEEDVSDLED